MSILVNFSLVIVYHQFLLLRDLRFRWREAITDTTTAARTTITRAIPRPRGNVDGGFRKRYFDKFEMYDMGRGTLVYYIIIFFYYNVIVLKNTIYNYFLSKCRKYPYFFPPSSVFSRYVEW